MLPISASSLLSFFEEKKDEEWFIPFVFIKVLRVWEETAKFIPSVSLLSNPATATPTTSPSAFKTGPPLFPGLRAASIWICETLLPKPARALTIPFVILTLLLNDLPNGNPNATISSPNSAPDLFISR